MKSFIEDSLLTSNFKIETDNHKGKSLIISTIKGPFGCTLGLTSCPGRNYTDLAGKNWQGSLYKDLKTIDKWKADVLLTLLETNELQCMGVPDLFKEIRQYKYRSYHLPIEDLRPPGPAFKLAWNKHGPTILNDLKKGRRVAIHCAAGLGRSGTIAAKLLISLGILPTQAIEQVRTSRPGAIESKSQELYVLNNEIL